jgi:hypothetical protein
VLGRDHFQSHRPWILSLTCRLQVCIPHPCAADSHTLHSHAARAGDRYCGRSQPTLISVTGSFQQTDAAGNGDSKAFPSTPRNFQTLLDWRANSVTIDAPGSMLMRHIRTTANCPESLDSKMLPVAGIKHWGTPASGLVGNQSVSFKDLAQFTLP